MRILISESSLYNIINQLSENIKFDWNRGTYSWKNNKSSTNVNTSMVNRDELTNKVKIKYTKRLLPKSNVVSYNLLDIKNFNITQALKHNIVKNRPIMTKDGKGTTVTTELTPDKSIDDFKVYVAKYIIRLLSHLHKDVDVILTPQSSSSFNSDITNNIKQIYEEEYGKLVLVKNNALVKTTKNIQVDVEGGKEYIKKEIEKKYPEDPSEKIDERLKLAIQKIYDDVRIWKIEDEIEPYMLNNVYKIHDILRRVKTSDNPLYYNVKKVNELQLLIDHLIKNLNRIINERELYKTKYFHYNKLKNKEDITPFQIKSISDAVRRTIYNIYSLSKDMNTKYSYETKNGTVTGESKFIDQLKRKNKTILIFDDNISSGRTMDDVCYHLITNGINEENIIVITLGTVPLSGYSLHKYAETN